MPSTLTDRLNGILTSTAVKPACVTVTSSNVTLSGLQTIGGVTLEDADRILVISQTDATQNGIYVASSGSWIRARDFDGNRDAVQGTLVLVRSDGVDGAIYELTTLNPVVIGTSELTFDLREDPAAIYVQTQAEIDEGEVPLNTSHPPGYLLRFGVNSTPGSTHLSSAIQSIVDAADSLHPNLRFSQQVAINETILLRSDTTQSFSIVGESRLASGLEPGSADISVPIRDDDPAEDVNCAIFNACPNGHLHLQSFNWSDDEVFTGKFLVAIEGGGADNSGQALFSGYFHDLWISPSSNNTGAYQGAFSNLTHFGCVYEGIKDAVWILQGGGNGDQQHWGITQNACFDSYIRQVDDGALLSLFSVRGLHAYQHKRGRLLDLVKVNDFHAVDIKLQPDAANFGDCGLVKFRNGQATFDGLKMTIDNPTIPRGAVGIEIATTTTSKVAVSDSKIVADKGILISGAGAIDWTFDNCDLTGCGNAAEVTAAVSGTITFNNCTFADMDKYGFLDVANSLNWNFHNCVIKNAGSDGTTTARLFDLVTTGKVRLIDCQYGLDDVDALATHWFRKESGGTFEVIRGRRLGTPPTAVTTGAGTVSFVYETGYGGVLASAAAMTLPAYGDIFDISGSTSITSIVATNCEGRRITLAFQGALTVTDGGNIKSAGDFVTSSLDTWSAVCIGANWYETGRSAN